VIQNMLARETLFLQELEILHKVADREVRRVALPIIAKLLACLETGNVRNGKRVAVVAAGLERGANQVFVLPGEAAKQNRYAVAFFRSERPLDGTVEVPRRAESSLFAQTGSFGREALLEFLILLNLYESRCHVVSLAGLSGIVFPKFCLCNGAPVPEACSAPMRAIDAQRVSSPPLRT